MMRPNQYSISCPHGSTTTDNYSVSYGLETLDSVAFGDYFSIKSAPVNYLYKVKGMLRKNDPKKSKENKIRETQKK